MVKEAYCKSKRGLLHYTCAHMCKFMHPHTRTNIYRSLLLTFVAKETYHTDIVPHTCVNACTHIHVHTYVNTCTHICKNIHTCTYTRTRDPAHAQSLSHYLHMYARACAYTRTHAHTHTHNTQHTHTQHTNEHTHTLWHPRVGMRAVIHIKRGLLL